MTEKLSFGVHGDVRDMDPVCGDCGKNQSGHFVENGVAYCNELTTGDVFTSEPSSEALIEHMKDHHPTMFNSILRNWKFHNGHYLG